MITKLQRQVLYQMVRGWELYQNKAGYWWLHAPNFDQRSDRVHAGTVAALIRRDWIELRWPYGWKVTTTGMVALDVAEVAQ